MALARFNALNILTQTEILLKEDDSSRSGYDWTTAQGGPGHPCLLVQCSFHIVEDLPGAKSIQDIFDEQASRCIKPNMQSCGCCGPAF